MFDNCNLTLGNKNFFELTTDGRYFNSLTIKNSKVKLNNSMYLVHIDKNTSTKFGNLSLVNNVFYAEAVTSGNGFKILILRMLPQVWTNWFLIIIHLLMFVLIGVECIISLV